MKDEKVEKSLNEDVFRQKHLPDLGEGGAEVVVKELSTRMVQLRYQIICCNRSVHHVRGEELDGQKLKEYKGVKRKSVFTINHKGLVALISSISATYQV